MSKNRLKLHFLAINNIIKNNYNLKNMIKIKNK